MVLVVEGAGEGVAVGTGVGVGLGVGAGIVVLVAGEFDWVGELVGLGVGKGRDGGGPPDVDVLLDDNFEVNSCFNSWLKPIGVILTPPTGGFLTSVGEEVEVVVVFVGDEE